MIHALKHNKVPRTLFKGNEDSLTSAIFERMIYLPSEVIHYILENSLFDTIPNLDFHQLQSIEFWPRWDSTGTSNSNSVEPDLFIRTINYDIIIEAKRYDVKQQSKSQWYNEILSYYNEYEDDAKNLLLIALGGINTIETEEEVLKEKNIKILKCTWSRILSTISSLHFQWESSPYLSNATKAQSRIIEDMILCFALFGFSTAPFIERFIKPISINPKHIHKLSSKWIK